MKILKCFCGLLLWNFLGLSVWAAKYPPLTAEEMMNLAQEAASYYTQQVEAGKTPASVLEEFGLAPRFRIIPETWPALEAEINDSEIVSKLEFLKNEEFAQFPLQNKLIELFGKKVGFEVVAAIVMKHAEETFSTRWAKGEIADYRFVITYNCEKKIHASHPFLKHMVNTPNIDGLKDVQGKRYVLSACLATSLKPQGVWFEAFLAVPGKIKEKPSRLVGFMLQIPQSPYQVGVVRRGLETPLEELNAMIK